MKFKKFLETSLDDLYSSAIEAFPNTTRRQHSTDTIVITEINWIPYKLMKTLFIKGLAQNEGKEYNPILLFKQVDYNPNVNKVKLIANDGKDYILRQLSLENNDVLVRCNCGDFKYRFSWYNKLDKSLYGKEGKKYESQGGPPANPKEMPGMCKHIMAFAKVLKQANILK